jgi:hypothetical protein
METAEVGNKQRRPALPRKGDRIERILGSCGVTVRGTVFYSDELQILVKWDDGRSESVRSDLADHFRIVEARASAVPTCAAAIPSVSSTRFE